MSARGTSIARLWLLRGSSTGSVLCPCSGSVLGSGVRGQGSEDVVTVGKNRDLLSFVILDDTGNEKGFTAEAVVSVTYYCITALLLHHNRNNQKSFSRAACCFGAKLFICQL